ncbi:MAG: FAD-dependent oxidoreductase [Taibaiella sp.]|nr:FAD-dependent oxidoreductase [Taibaiella sp.]
MAIEQTLSTRCCIAGGGPAGMMLGFLLARAGVDVIVLEKHADFFRDFRGDTIHPSTFQVMDELDLLEEFLQVPHQETQYLNAQFNDTLIHLGDFSHLKIAKPALGFMPQWDFLKFIMREATKYPTFKLKMGAEVRSLIKTKDRITGVVCQTPGGPINIQAALVVGCDGRDSLVRQLAGLNVIATGAPIDVLWFSLSKKISDPDKVLGYFAYGKLLVMIDRGEHWQCGYVIPKGGFDKIKSGSLNQFKSEIVQIAGFIHNRVDELKSWDDIKLLSVAIDHLEKWYTDGLLCIGDAAHAMSPVGGVGINLAIQDAVAAANLLYKPLMTGKPVPNVVLNRIQHRRSFPARVIQRMQVVIQKGLIKRRKSNVDRKPPLLMRLLNALPILRRIPAKLVGMGVRPEHVKTPQVIEG